MEREIIVTYEALFELLMREKGREAIQPLEPGFFANLARYLKDKRVALESLTKEGGLESSEVERNAKQLQNIYRLVRELYERRERKILNMALIKSRTGSEALDTAAMLKEELDLFERAASHLNEYRTNILHQVLAGEAPNYSQREVTDVPASEAPEPTPEPAPEPTPVSETLARLKLLDDVAEFVGKELETYGPFSQGQVVELPHEIAQILVAKGNAELL